MVMVVARRLLNRSSCFPTAPPNAASGSKAAFGVGMANGHQSGLAFKNVFEAKRGKE
jgi:hypothetical protein